MRRRALRTAPWMLLGIAASLAAPSPSLGQAAPGRAGGAAPAAGAINLIELTAEQIQKDYAARRYTAAQLTRAYLDRIAQYEDHYNAFISMNPDAMRIAAELDAEYARSGPRGPLHGVPVVIKDNIDYGGLVTTAGWSGFSKATGGVDMIPQNDAEAVARLRAAGAIILGKTNMPDFAGNGTHSKSTVAGVTLNPYALDRIPGGSSGGTATAVNGSLAVLGLGTETGGSIQNPASAQALVGVKPTFGLVPLHGVVPIDATYRDVVGPLARSVYDAALALDVIAGPTPKDFATYASEGRRPDSGYVAGLNERALEGKRFGLVGPGWRTQYLPLAPETEALYRKAIEALKAQGAEVVEDPFAGTGWIQQYNTNRGGGGTAGTHDLWVYLQNLGEGAPFNSIKEWEALAGRPFGRNSGPPTVVSATEAGDAFGAWRRDIRALYRKVMTDNRLDGLFFPQAGAPITKLIDDPTRPEATPNNHPELPSNIINDIGLPTITVPAAYYADGTPIVVAFIGDLWTDAQLLGYAFDFEKAVHARVAPRLVPKPTP